ncbi:hypothetical protein [Solibacillus faecavium]|uniref:hypothetical protein n=1 Tax=Solibacillus faecavium TaxID=2762221 RepID=UPI0017800216|nr:hypothetical protein [Solibacillus faecavium]
MNRKMGTSIFVYFCFFMWLYFAIYESSIDNWWTVLEITQETDHIVDIEVSLVKLLIGTIIFTISGFLINLLLSNLPIKD